MSSTYLWLNLVFVCVAVGLVLTSWRYRPAPRAWAWLALLLVLATLVVDNLLTSLPVVAYDPDLTLGLHLGAMPIEDLAYALVVAGLVPVLWRLVEVKRGDRLRLGEVLRASRPTAWVYTAGPFLVGAYLAYGRVTTPLVVGAVYFLVPYNLALYGVNDIYDYESDLKNPRRGGVEGGVLPRTKHRQLWHWIVLANLPFLAYLLTIGPRLSRLWLMFALFMVLAYSQRHLRFKEIPFIDSLTASTHFWAPLVYGTLLGGSVVGYRPALAAFILWGMGSHALSASRDAAYDRAAGTGTIATALGERGTIYFSLVCYSLAAMLPVLGYGMAGLVPGLALLTYSMNIYVAGFGDSPSPVRLRRAWRVFTRLNVLVGIVLVVALILTLNPFGWSSVAR